MKNLNNKKVIKVTCDCCGKEIECPVDMLKTSKKHVCFQCFQNPKNFNNFSDEERKNVHVDIPMEKFTDALADNLATKMVDDTFPEIWSQKKEDLREFSKKDLAKEMFGAGVYLGAQTIMDSLQEMGEIDKITKNKVKR